ncbi:GTP cyclohydrolase I FolE2 [Thermoleophilia bacterium SCSIO 60948]|nr:GTP cyclohydrolase I FolE2 [Thermoleophilia bacterium SCSIO 60948]
MTSRAEDHAPAATGVTALDSSGEPDVQAGLPATQVSLSRVGVTGVEKVIKIEGPGGGQGPDLFFAELECLVDLRPQQAGVHMSRFEEIVNEAIDSVVLGESLRVETLAAHIAERIRERQDGRRAEVTIAARYPERMQAPASGLESQEIYRIFGTAVASERGTRRMAGVEAQGMTACPCAQGLLSARARERLIDDGFDTDEIERIFRAVPVATHNQRGIGRIDLGVPEGAELDVDAREILSIVEASMSSEIYELMKRSDEASVVEKAHMQPRFVEDVVREMIRRVASDFPELAGAGFVWARQENLETIHRHSVIAERYGLLSEVALELATGEHSPRHMTRREWLEAPSS